MKLLSVQSSPAFHHFFLLGPYILSTKDLLAVSEL